MEILTTDTTTAEIAAVLAVSWTGAAEVTADPEVTAELVLNASDTTIPGCQTEHRAQALAWVVRWTWHSVSRGPRPQVATLIQVTQGGREFGEGWALFSQHVVRAALTEDEAGTVASLIARGALPELIEQEEV